MSSTPSQLYKKNNYLYNTPMYVFIFWYVQLYKVYYARRPFKFTIIRFRLSQMFERLDCVFCWRFLVSLNFYWIDVCFWIPFIYYYYYYYEWRPHTLIILLVYFVFSLFRSSNLKWLGTQRLLDGIHNETGSIDFPQRTNI